MKASENYCSEAKQSESELMNDLKSELKKQISTTEKLEKENLELRGQNSSLKNQIQSKERTIKSLSNRIEKLSKSDLELQKSKELNKSAQQKLNDAKEKLKESEKNNREADQKLADGKALIDEANRRASWTDYRESRIDEIVENRVKEETKEIRENAKREIEEGVQAVKEEAEEEEKRTWRKASISILSLTVYNVVLSIAWVIGQKKILKTIPEWFSKQWKVFSDYFWAVLVIHKWIVTSLPDSWAAFPRHGLATLCTVTLLSLVLFAIVIMISFVWSNMQKAFQRYENAGHEIKMRKRQTSFLIAAVSLVLSFLLVMLLKTTPLNVVSWWLIFCGSGLYVYHFISVIQVVKKEREG